MPASVVSMTGVFHFHIDFFSFSRHNSYIQECTGHLEPTYHASIHDLRLLLQRFAFENSFSEDTGGGGRDSNIKFVPYAMHMILYVLNKKAPLIRHFSCNASTSEVSVPVVLPFSLPFFLAGGGVGNLQSHEG